MMPFSDGEVIMQQGEPASWVGILLEGELAARKDGTVPASLKSEPGGGGHIYTLPRK